MCNKARHRLLSKGLLSINNSINTCKVPIALIEVDYHRQNYRSRDLKQI